MLAMAGIKCKVHSSLFQVHTNCSSNYKEAHAPILEVEESCNCSHNDDDSENNYLTHSTLTPAQRHPDRM